jgi:hypothetical protein
LLALVVRRDAQISQLLERAAALEAEVARLRRDSSNSSKLPLYLVKFQLRIGHHQVLDSSSHLFYSYRFHTDWFAEAAHVTTWATRHILVENDPVSFTVRTKPSRI